MDFREFLDRLSSPVQPASLGLVAVALLAGLYGFDRKVHTEALVAQANFNEAKHLEDQVSTAINHFQALADLKSQDVAQFKNGMSNLAQSNKTLFETGLSLHEEKRLLEKQWDILTTYLALNPTLQRIFLMRGDEPLASYPVHFIPLKAFGGAPETIRGIVRIVSKERFAAPERGRSELVDGKLQYIPPQVGTSVRSNALGEYVVFTNSRLILHGPPINEAAHEAFPHLCLGLSLSAARQLYQHSFIGTKIAINSSVGTRPPPAPPLSQDTISSTTVTGASTTLPSLK